MSRFRRIDVIEPSPFFFLRETSVYTPKTLIFNPFIPSFLPLVDDEQLESTLDLLNPSPFDEIDAITDLVQIEKTPFYTSTRRVQRRVEKRSNESYLQSLCDRVSELELGFERLNKSKASSGDRKYTWTAEINSPEKDGVDRKYKWVTEIKGGKKKEKSFKLTAEIKGKGEDSPISRTYTFKASTGKASECTDKKETKNEKKEEKSKKKTEKPAGSARIVEIQEHPDHGAVVLRQAFARRAGASAKSKGKKKQLSPQDAAMMIQITFRAYLIRRSQALRALRDLAVAKARLKDLRALFNNFSYRRRVNHDAEERQRFTEKIIVLLLTVDSIEGADLMVRSAKRSMVDELEAMLDVVDPQPIQGQGRSLSMKRRTFDMPDGIIQKEIAAAVSQVVRMSQEEENDNEASEASA